MAQPRAPRPQAHAPTETTFDPESARAIALATEARGYNFRGGDVFRSNHTAKLANAMRAGQWHWRDAPPLRLLVLPDGATVCSDGVHRLAACALSGVPMRALVLEGTEWEAGYNTDRGASRTIGQYLTHLGYANGNQRAAIVRTHLVRITAHKRGLTIGGASHYVTTEDVVSYAKANDEALTAVANQAKQANGRGWGATGYGVFLHEVSHIEPEWADAWHDDVMRAPLEPHDPLAQLLSFTARMFAHRGKRFSTEWVIDNMVKAWNLRMAGKALTMWRPPSPSTEPRFPEGYPL